MRKMKIFLSHPMSVKKNEDILSMREWMTDIAKDYFKRHGIVEDPDVQIEVIDSYIEHEIAYDINYPNVYMLGKSISLLSKADWIIVHPDWNKAQGCKIELNVAYTYRIPILYLGNSKLSPPKAILH